MKWAFEVSNTACTLYWAVNP